ncbi:N-acetyllactosaminide beta-1,3-N-acetylglucosaminyltransferase 2a [Trichomycterus rosablanca]|uniref:N-acetyllactosaminide beta-1,3-N-acetylglucosaminyltransferase 2a n=1 Tax=Trichomycterus rosablanca TaxID=2290929 RepID=UPI002F35936F
MTPNWNKTKLLGVMMTVNFLIYILVEVTRSYRQGGLYAGHPYMPSRHFWKKPKLSKAIWNRKQQHLDHIHNPLINSASSVRRFLPLPDLLRPSDRLKTTSCELDLNLSAQMDGYASLPDRFKDFLLHMQCRSYPLLIDAAGVCSDPPFLLLVVKTLAPHFDRRQAIRQSWGRAGILDGRRVAVVFLLGRTSARDHLPDVSDLLRHEARLHADLLQWDFRDAFFNLTLKEVLFLEWMGERCPLARYVFKGDDDVFVNTRSILRFLGRLSGDKARDLFVGDVISRAQPDRAVKSKYYVPESIFAGVYPPYAGGGGYLYSGDVALRLRNVSRRVLLYPIDDVYTGICLQKLGLVPEKHKGFRTFNIDEKFKEDACTYKSLMLVHPRGPREVMQIWSWINNPGLNCK